MSAGRPKGVVEILQSFSIPLVSGVFVALVAANLWTAETYASVLHWEPFGDWTIYEQPLTLHFLVNDVFMVFFFGIAAKEITESCLPGGSLNPIRKAITPLIATLGGVIGPIAVFFGGLLMAFQLGIYTPSDDFAQLARGWGIPTATDIALAWLLARSVFGAGHPAIAFLLLLAVADDAIGLVIIAGFYGDPAHPVVPAYLLLVVLGMAIAYGMRRAGLRSWIPYVGIAGPVAWSGLMLAHLHPALALVLIVPFLPGPSRDTGLFLDSDEVDLAGPEADLDAHSPLHLFEHQTKLFVDFGLFFFAFCNAGVQFASIGPLTWLILAALVVGKTCGVTFAVVGARSVGFALPVGMSTRDLVMSGFIAALGLTVALFVAEAAYVDPILQGQAKMGALFSGLVGVPALLIGRMLGLGRDTTRKSAVPQASQGAPPDPLEIGGGD